MVARTIIKQTRPFPKDIKIPIGSDHAGFEIKSIIITHLINMGYDFEDVGTYSKDSCDYPDFIHKVAEKVSKKESKIGICICGSGQGANMVANKHKGVRAALCWFPEIAKLSREHNDANILTIPARFVSELDVKIIVATFLQTNFEGGRHKRRIDKIEL